VYIIRQSHLVQERRKCTGDIGNGRLELRDQGLGLLELDFPGRHVRLGIGPVQWGVSGIPLERLQRGTEALEYLANVALNYTVLIFIE